MMYDMLRSAEDTLDRHCNPAKPTVHDIPLFSYAVSDYIDKENPTVREELNSLWSTIFPSLTLILRNKEELRVQSLHGLEYNAEELSDGEKEGTSRTTSCALHSQPPPQCS